MIFSYILYGYHFNVFSHKQSCSLIHHLAPIVYLLQIFFSPCKFPSFPWHWTPVSKSMDSLLGQFQELHCFQQPWSILSSSMSHEDGHYQPKTIHLVVDYTQPWYSREHRQISWSWSHTFYHFWTPSDVIFAFDSVC